MVLSEIFDGSTAAVALRPESIGSSNGIRYHGLVHRLTGKRKFRSFEYYAHLMLRRIGTQGRLLRRCSHTRYKELCINRWLLWPTAMLCSPLWYHRMNGSMSSLRINVGNPSLCDEKNCIPKTTKRTGKIISVLA